jgi:aminomethyltransferase
MGCPDREVRFPGRDPARSFDKRITKETMSDSARTPLHDWHVEQGGRMVDFAGWSMPVQYTSIVEEHLATRNQAGLFDISHMGRIEFQGPDACRFLDCIVTRRVTELAAGGIRYSLITNAAGGILDDVLVYRQAAPDSYLLVVNAGNRGKILQWLDDQRSDLPAGISPEKFDWHDRTEATVMLALQGPEALAIAQDLVDDDFVLGHLRYYSCRETRMLGHPTLVSRTGYTGEDGCELIVERERGLELATKLWETGRERGLKLAGLGARDTLRLEAGMPLYGHELSEEIDPYQADLAFAVQLKGRYFVGCESLAQLAHKPPPRRRIGLTFSGRRVPREGYLVFSEESGERPIGVITSGTFSPTFEQPIAMAYVEASAIEDSRNFSVEVRGTRLPATLAKLPFYRRRDSSQ